MEVADVLFDLDDTLCDFSGARDRGLANAVQLLPGDCRQEAFTIWKNHEPALFRSFADKKITRDDYRYERFRMLIPAELTEEQVHLPGQMNECFMLEVNDRITLVDGAVDCLQTLGIQNIRCHLVTNGPTDGQRQKIKRLKLESWLEYIQIGEEVGVFKPDPQAFELALAQIGRPPETVVMVGDSLRDDIDPAKKLGMRAIHVSLQSDQGVPLAQVAAMVSSFNEAGGPPDR